MMASRRTRIKGIANIPQRRKTATNTSTEDNCKTPSDLEHVSQENPNLNLEHETPDITVNNVEIPANEKDTQDNNVKSEGLQKETPKDEENEERGDQGSLELPTAAILLENNKEVETPKNNLIQETPHQSLGVVEKIVENNQEPKPLPLVRRKFIKPTIAVNTICRRPKDTEEGKSVVGVPVNGKNAKIVILNETISYSNLNQDIFINNHKPESHVNFRSDAHGHLLKPPEAYNARSPINSSERDTKRLIPNSPQLLSPDVEYPIPPPSPSKINRSRIKAVPRLGQRNTSFSASESEDESRRNYRHRNDSVSSAASGVQDSNSIPECFSPQKPREYNSVIQRKCRRTEQSRKLAEARRDFYLKFGNSKPDRQKLTMMDLIFYNPVTNPMSGDKSKRKNSETEIESEIQEPKVDEEVEEPAKTGSDEENEIPAPQIKIGPQGEIVVDEQSLVIENKSVKKNRQELEKSKVVNGDSETVYGVYKRAKRSKDWSKAETLKFYKALNTIGTDFTLMCELFPRRSRRELKMKFKKEERVNRSLVDKAIMKPCGFDFNEFKHEVDMEEKELQEMEKQKEREKIIKQDAKKRKAALPCKEPPEKQPKMEKLNKRKRKQSFSILNVLEDSDADESELESVGDEESHDMLETIQKPTRSGRVPKILERYKPPEPEPKSRPEPGSLVVVASTGPNGQAVYKVCMVTGENGRQQIGDDMNSLAKALKCKENNLTSIFTLSATPTGFANPPENNQTIPAEENNVTIPAEENNVTTPAEEVSSSNVNESSVPGQI